MKYILVGLAAVIYAINAEDRFCSVKSEKQVPTEWRTLRYSDCSDSLRRQIRTEIGAAMTYLAMGAHFSKDTINRPGFAEFFFKAASEERGHAIKLIDYLIMRGELSGDDKDFEALTFSLTPRAESWADGYTAIEDALYLESEVTESIKKLIGDCEAAKYTDGPNKGKKFNDYHLADYLTGDFLEEQYKGLKDLADKTSTLGKMLSKHKQLGEFLFDKKLLYGDLF